uniref:Multicopper oxidase n=1 Tax=Steinernema glaseri TaxID=37863 RepID=A0A1I7XZJ2_9BILA
MVADDCSSSFFGRTLIAVIQMLLVHLVAFLLYLPCAICWQKYADEIKMATPNSDGVYEFDLVLKHQLTMSHVRNSFGHLDILDYKPDEVTVLTMDRANSCFQKTFWVRSADQLEACDKTSPFVKDALNASTDTSSLEDVLIMHGLHQRVVTINGVSPGKTLIVPYNAEVIMRVKNRLLLEGVTVHLHGVDKKFSWYTDGVAYVQQCPISVNSNFAYRFYADTPGTHWYHGHLMSDRGDGLLGGFIIVKDNETYPNPAPGAPRFEFGKIRQYYALLQDWPVPTSAESWYSHVGETMKWLYGFDNNDNTCWTPTRISDGSNLGGAVPISAILVNDKGWHSQADIRSRPSALPLETFRIKTNEEIIIRFVNGGVAQELMFTIEEHDMYIIAADGVEVKPKKVGYTMQAVFKQAIQVDSVIIFSGERYDILIKHSGKPTRKVYPILIETIDTVSWTWKNTAPFVGLAKLEYEDVNAPETDEVDFNHSNCKKDSKCVVVNCPFGEFPPDKNFHCLNAVDLESAEIADPVDQQMIQKKTFSDDEFVEHFINMHYDSHVDGYMFKLPRGVPYFYEKEQKLSEVAMECDKTKCTNSSSRYDPNCQCFWHLTFPLNKIVQLTVYNMGKGGGNGTGYAHPLHIHGTHFYLMKVGYPSYNANGFLSGMNPDIPCASGLDSCNRLKWANKEWMMGNVPGMKEIPSSRDTVVVPVGGYVTLSTLTHATSLRFKATNPGWFFAHCHLMLHNMGGTAFAYRTGEPHEIPAPPDAYPHSCGDFEPTKAGGVQVGATTTASAPITTTKGSSTSGFSVAAVYTAIVIAFANMIR